MDMVQQSKGNQLMVRKHLWSSDHQIIVLRLMKVIAKSKLHFLSV